MMTPISCRHVHTTTNDDTANRIRSRILAGLGRSITTAQRNLWNARFCELNDRFAFKIDANTRFEPYVLMILPDYGFMSE